ncbi:alkaline phosphatase family protein [Ferruginibacter sp.]|uniref:alkaline phosphatase family protein n=1 Tax=Ferruginibacter sp. TaxID=1940288 RepID=UPI001990BA83|nr:alkaline phosphatase family protein [Ferruginibacter sp.]MBC7627010.1 alkaline phosphatase family protein [Ferruginibacter sp.]
MKAIYCICIFLTLTSITHAQPAAQNVFIITMDGTRWQEIFKGADEALLRNINYVKDTTLMLQQYSHTDPEERRRRLLPFFWSVLAQQGQLMGNRNFDNDVNVANLYKISYPGYSEIFTGFADKLFIPNLAVNNPRSNVLQWLSTQPLYQGKVAAFCSWRVLPFILNEKDGAFPVNGGYEALYEKDSTSTLINGVQQNVYNQGSTRHDLLTFECAKNYMQKNHPKVLYLGLGETDEFAHEGAYDTYLQKIHQADAMIAELWYAVQTDPFYKNNTTFIITTDHGRGNKTNTWTTHGFWVKGSGQTWLAMLGAGVSAGGEEKYKQQLYQKQIAATVAALLGLQFKTNHRVAKAMPVERIEPVTEIVAAVKGE